MALLFVPELSSLRPALMPAPALFVRCKSESGLVSFMPILPAEVIRSLSALFVPNVTVLDAGENIDPPVPTLNPELF